MAQAFYEKAGSLISPGDIFDRLPYARVPKPLRIARKFSGSLPKSIRVKGELREVFEYGRDTTNPPFNFEPPGEDILSNAKMAKAIFLTWGSEVEDDQRSGKLHKKEWLIAPIFSLDSLKREAEIIDSGTGQRVNIVEAIQTGRSPKYFPLEPLPGDSESLGYYVDFRRVCPLAATHFDAPRQWRLSAAALNDFYHQLIWFFTRREIFFRPIQCTKCGAVVDLGIVFEGQPVEPQEGEQL